MNGFIYQHPALLIESMKQASIFVCFYRRIKDMCMKATWGSCSKRHQLSHIFKFLVFFVFTQEARLLIPLKFHCAYYEIWLFWLCFIFQLVIMSSTVFSLLEMYFSLLFHSLINPVSWFMSLFRVYMYLLSSYFYTSPEEWKVIHVLSWVRTPYHF